jgi:hypothetical protein
MSAPNRQDTTDPNSLLYYAPRRLRDRASALRTTQMDSRQPSLAPQAYGGPSNPLPEILRVSEPEPMEAPSLLSQRARKKQVLAPVIRFVAVAGLAAAAAFTYVVIFTELPDQNTVNEVAGAPKIESNEPAINEPVSVKVTGSNPGDVTTPSGSPADTKLTAGMSETPQSATEPIVETMGSREPSGRVAPGQNPPLFPPFLLWQESYAQREVPVTAQQNIPTTRNPAPRRKRKARNTQVDEDE